MNGSPVTPAKPSLPRISNQRGDVLGLYASDYPLQPVSFLIDALGILGYFAKDTGDGHFVLCALEGPGQIHLYGQHELTAFIGRRLEKRRGTIAKVHALSG